MKFSYCIFNLILVFYVNAAVQNPNELQIFGENCVLTEPLYNKSFNFTTLVSDLAHVVELNYNEQIEFNVCQNLTKKCNGTDGISACLVKRMEDGKTKEIILGYQQSLGSYNGRIDFNFTGEKCNEKENYQFHVVLHCDYEANAGDLRLQSYDSNSCIYYLFWPTASACLPDDSTNNRGNDDCVVKDQHNHEFNLNALNYHHHRIKYNQEPGKFFLINACKPINYGHNAMCPPGSSICLVDENAKTLDKKFFNYGTISGKPYFKDDIIWIDYKSDEKCNGTQNFTTTISFPCNRETIVAEPEFLGYINCQYFFTWQTPQTCRTQNPCTAINAQTGDVYDLSPLSENEYKVQHDGIDYNFGVCKGTKTVCLNNAGICKNDKSIVTLGVANDKLIFNVTGSPYLVYKNGAQCGDELGSYWQTKIYFICAPFDASTEQITVIENTNCEIVIHFITPLACPKEQMKCKVVNDEDGKIYDLSPLRNNKENYKAIVNTTSLNDTFVKTKDGTLEYYINICRPLVPQFGLSCHGGSAACLGVTAANSTPENELSLGFADPSVTIVNNRPHLLYVRGSPCPSDSALQLSSDIEFVCDPKGGYGKPVLTEYSDCQYKFLWASNIICPKHTCSFNSETCEITNEQINQKFDLKKIENNGIITVKEILQPLNINLCNVSELQATTNYEQSSVNIFFMIKGPCETDDGYLRVDLNLLCKKTRQLNVKLNTTCSLEVNLETSIICPFLGIQIEEAKENVANTTDVTPTVPSTGGNDTKSNGSDTNKTETGIVINPDTDDDKSHGISTIGVIMISLVISLMLGTVVYVLRTPDRRARIMSLVRRRSLPIQYSRVQSGEEANLLLPQTGTLADSDEEMLI